MRRFSSAVLASAIFFFLVQEAPAVSASATLSLSPAAAYQPLSTSFNVDVKLDSGSDTVKTIKAYLTFPANLLSVEDILTAGSVISVWSERLYSNTNGTINLNGEAVAAGIAGKDKLAATIKFKVKSSGTATVRFAAASQVLKLSDSTDILSLTASTNGSYTLGAAPSPSATPSGTKVPEAGFPSPTIAVLALSFFLIILGILLGRSTSQNS